MVIAQFLTKLQIPKGIFETRRRVSGLFTTVNQDRCHFYFLIGLLKRKLITLN